MMSDFLHKLWEDGWITRVLYVLGAIVAALILTAAANTIIGRALRRNKSANLRADTIGKLLRNIVTYVVWFLAILQILQRGFGVDITSIIAAAGVLGVAVGFGAQTLVKDIITGFFILFENQYSVGEQVTVDGFAGTVEELGLRTTKIRNGEGALLIIPNGAVGKVINHSRNG